MTMKGIILDKRFRDPNSRLENKKNGLRIMRRRVNDASIFWCRQWRLGLEGRSAQTG
jgi:hypothetical protein